MASVIRVTPTETKPTHHFTLDDGLGNVIGIIARNINGEAVVDSVNRVPYDKSGLRVQQGGGPFSEQKPPYGEFSRSSWINGMGQEEGEADASAYWFGKNIWTLADGKMMIGPKLISPGTTASGNTGTPDANHVSLRNHPTSPVALITLATKVDTSVLAGGQAESITIKAKGVGNLTMEIVNDKAGVPDTVAATYTQVINSAAAYVDVVYPTMANGTFWFRIKGEYIDIATKTNASFPAKLQDGTGEKPAIFSMALTTMLGTTWGEFFEYRGGLYYITMPKSGTSRLYVNGDRGAADDNTADKTKLNDAAKSWTTNQWANWYVRISEGPGVWEWRRVVSNTATALVVDRAWDMVHTTATFYFLYGGNAWTEVTGIGIANVKDVCVSNKNVVYFAQGMDTHIRAYNEYITGGNWTKRYSDDGTNHADLMCANWDGKNPVIWRARNDTTPAISSSPTKDYGTALVFGTEVPVGDPTPIKGMTPWDGQVAAVKSNSIWMVKAGIPEKLSVDMSAQFEEFTGKNPRVFTPYLIFPYGNGIERLVGQNSEEFAPTMPTTYGGQFVDSQPIPGALIAARRGVIMTNNTTNSMIMIYHNGFWHPLYAIDGTNQLYSLYFERLDAGMDILWISSENGIQGLRFPREWDYLKDVAFIDSGVAIAPQGYAITGYYNVGNKRIDKWWENIYCHLSKYGSGTGAKLEVYYQTSRYLSDTDMSTWTLAGTVTDASGVITLRVESKEIRFMFVLSGTSTAVPIFHGFNVQYSARIDVNFQFSIPILVEDYGYDLQGQPDGVSAATVTALLDGFAASITPITLRSTLSAFDNKRVLIGPVALRPVTLDTSKLSASGQQREKYIGTLSIYEVT